MCVCGRESLSDSGVILLFCRPATVLYCASHQAECWNSPSHTPPCRVALDRIRLYVNQCRAPPLVAYTDNVVSISIMRTMRKNLGQLRNCVPRRTRRVARGVLRVGKSINRKSKRFSFRAFPRRSAHTHSKCYINKSDADDVSILSLCCRLVQRGREDNNIYKRTSRCNHIAN